MLRSLWSEADNIYQIPSSNLSSLRCCRCAGRIARYPVAVAMNPSSRRHLLSSPSRMSMQGEALVILSSSPDFPSIDELLPKREKKTLLRSGSRAAPIPDTASKSFTTASHFWQSKIAEENESAGASGRAIIRQDSGQLDIQRPLSVPRDAVRCGEPAETGPASVDQGAGTHPSEPPSQPVPTKRVGRAKLTSVPADETVAETLSSPKEKPWKKFKEKDPTDGQTKIAKGKVTKPSAAKPKQPLKKAETISKHFAPPVAPDPIELEDDPIDLEPALKRRTDWTPTKNTEPSVILLDSSTVKGLSSPRPTGAESSFPPRTDLFKNLRDTYSCAEVEDAARASMSRDEPGDVLGKRKLIEMVTTSETARSKTPEVSPVKQKAPKKKPRTITDLATAAYRVVDTASAEEQPRDDSLLNYFTPNEESEPAKPSKREAVTGKAKGSKPRAKAKPKRASKKKAEPPQPSLLSPESALRQVSRQDFIFGTSSQLATEVDAGLLRDLQRAMRDSNRQEDDFFFDSSPVASKVAAKSTGYGLWGAGARDEGGELLEVEVIDLVDSPAIEEDLTNPKVILALAADKCKAREAEKLDSMSVIPAKDVDVITISSSLTPTLSKSSSPFAHKQNRTGNAVSGPAAASSTVEHQFVMQPVELDDDPPASNQEQHHQMAFSAPIIAAPAPPEIPAPKYELYTDAQLAREVQSYGFKPIKRRTAAIALLHQCWTSKHQAKAQAMGQGTTASLSTSSAATARAEAAASAPVTAKPRGRPKKTAPTAELQDSGPAATKRPRGRPKKASSSGGSAAPKPTSRPAGNPSTLPPSPTIPTSEATPGPSTPARKRITPTRMPVEIADTDDSDLDINPSSPSSTASCPIPPNEFSSPIPGVELSMTTEADDDTLTSSPTGQQTRLFRYITDAVKTAPRSRDPEAPSWHEKMLMYDPVVIEDLTAWLNGGELDRVGCEEEVGTGDVKKWCESRSVCCLYRVNINGKERKRF